MATSYTARGLPVLPWPAGIKPSEITLHIQANTSTFTSPFTRSTQTVDLPGALFGLEAAFPPVPLAAARLNDFRAFVARLRGGAGRFIFPANTCRYAPPGIGEGERTTWMPLTSDDYFVTADSDSVLIDADRVRMESAFTVTSCPDNVTILGTLWANSQRAPLRMGSYISWDDATDWRHLHMVVGLDLHPVTGAATLTLEPPMRALPTPETLMHVHSPSGIFRLVDDGQLAIRNAARMGTFSVQAQQAFPLEVTA